MTSRMMRMISRTRTEDLYDLHNGRLFVSGAYCGSDMTAEDERLWMGKTFKANMQGALRTDSLAGVNGMGLSFDFFRTLNASHYASTRCP